LGGEVRGVKGARREERLPGEIGESEIIETRGKKFANALRVGCRQCGKRLKNGLVRRVRETVARKTANGERAIVRREAILA